MRAREKRLPKQPSTMRNCAQLNVYKGFLWMPKACPGGRGEKKHEADARLFGPQRAAIELGNPGWAAPTIAINYF
jgi:hypothetical protein